MITDVLDEQIEKHNKSAERGRKALDEIKPANIANIANNEQQRGFAGANSAANIRRTLGDDEQNQAYDALVTPPKPAPEMFYGVLGQFAKQAANGTEVNPVAAMAAAMTWLSACMGRNPAAVVGDDWHHLRLYTLHVGRSSKGGKGMALGLLKRVIHTIQQLPNAEGLCPQIHSGGLSSREGLACLIHDGYREGKEDVPPIDDKRLFIVEQEFANVLGQTKREGNTLSPALREAWDGGDIRPATKSARIWASRPHIALHGCITPSELRTKIAANDLSNGFANRFLMFWAERTGVIAFPARASDEVVLDYANAFVDIIRSALNGYPHETNAVYLDLRRDARQLFEACIHEYEKPQPELLATLLVRRRPMLLRLAGLFAMTDRTTQINAQHVAASHAWMEYYAQSVALIFGPAIDLEAEAHRNEDAEKLFFWLEGKGDWKSRKTIVRECFGGHLGKNHIDAALESLSLENRIERREVDGGGPRKRTEYRVASPESAKFAQSSRQGSQAQETVIIKDSQSSQCSQAEPAEEGSEEHF
jgi:hypothetical protein